MRGSDLDLARQVTLAIGDPRFTDCRIKSPDIETDVNASDALTKAFIAGYVAGRLDQQAFVEGRVTKNLLRFEPAPDPKARINPVTQMKFNRYEIVVAAVIAAALLALLSLGGRDLALTSNDCAANPASCSWETK